MAMIYRSGFTLEEGAMVSMVSLSDSTPFEFKTESGFYSSHPIIPI